VELYTLADFVGMGGAPIGAGEHDPPLLEAKGTDGHNLGIIHISVLLLSRLYTNDNAENIRIRLT